MSVPISSMENVSAVGPPPHQGQGNPGQQYGAKEATAPTQEKGQEQDTIRLAGAAARKAVAAANSMASLQDHMNQLAIGTKQTSETLNTVSSTIGRLDGIVKNYPPFPKDESKRQETLMSYISIAKEIKKLTVPPPPPPVYERVQGEWSDLFTSQGNLHSTAIPGLNHSSSAEDIVAAGAGIGETGARLQSLRESIGSALKA